MKSEIKNTKKYASDLQTILSIREIQAKSTEYEKHFQSCLQNKYLDEISIESTIDVKINDILNVDRFGSIKVEKSPSSTIEIYRTKGRHAQIMVPKAKTWTNDVKLELKRKLSTSCDYSPGGCVTRKGEFIITYHEINYAKVLAINAEGEVENTILITEPSSAFDVESIDESTVAVSTGYCKKRGISIIDMTKKKIIKFIELPDYPYGISYNGKSLICCVECKDLILISFTDYSITTIPHTTQALYSYVSADANKIFFTNPVNHTVACCSYSGALMWKFKDKRVLNYPHGITINNNGYVFVVGMDSCNVVVISPDGKQCKQILTKKDGLDMPRSVYFDKLRNHLLVTNYKQLAFVYNVSYS
ncbi:uncharacterized protein LOC127705049 isoform X1 [Mytilus californianus]|uniref:uncharacterized protein LOC127705049 isoform X1 n=1 Tax=Mytilus californianus TaxID=6549 RepID=UPI002246A709|nr:uncharacterized protein LOC127705049 isoform X1 [Mytilus californianus]